MGVFILCLLFDKLVRFLWKYLQTKLQAYGVPTADPVIVGIIKIVLKIILLLK